MNPNKRTDDEIWIPIHEAICNGYYNTQKEYDKLPEDLKECVTKSQIRSWSIAPSDEMQWIRKEVIAEYRAREKRNKEYKLLSSKAKEILMIGDKKDG